MVSAESQSAMDAAKQAVAEFMARNGRHNTTVHERVAPAIYHETITRTEHEDLVTVIEREITQDHYHTSVQPITDTETLEEQHFHHELPVENREFQHDDPEDVRVRLEAERDKFRDEVQRVEGQKTQTVVPTLSAEHIHHHVHEIIQPVVNKHTIEPHVIHSTVFIREIHHNAAKHHILSALPAVTMAEFKKQGGVLIGRGERWDSFEGEPRSVGGNLGNAHVSDAAASAAAQAVTAESVASTHPAPSAPERRSSLPVSHHAKQTSASNAGSPATTSDSQTGATPSAQAMTEGRKLGEVPATVENNSVIAQSQPAAQASQVSSPTPAKSSAPRQSAQPPGRWNLLPMQLARGAGEGQPGHPVARSAAQQQQRGASSASGRQGSVAPRSKEGQQQQDQAARRES